MNDSKVWKFREPIKFVTKQAIKHETCYLITVQLDDAHSINKSYAKPLILNLQFRDLL